jgi:hypothetical protein
MSRIFAVALSVKSTFFYAIGFITARLSLNIPNG